MHSQHKSLLCSGHQIGIWWSSRTLRKEIKQKTLCEAMPLLLAVPLLFITTLVLLQNSQIQSLCLSLSLCFLPLQRYCYKNTLVSENDFACLTKFPFLVNMAVESLLINGILLWNVSKQGVHSRSVCRHCWIWQVSLFRINYWSLTLSMPLSRMLRILWYL